MAFVRVKFYFLARSYNTLILSIALLLTVQCFAQKGNGILKGRIADGSTYKSLYNVSVYVDSAQNSATSYSNGEYVLSLPKGKYTIVFQLSGFQAKHIENVTIDSKEVTHLDIILFPVSEQPALSKQISDSLPAGDSSTEISFAKEKRLIIYNQQKNVESMFDMLSRETIQPGTDKDGAELLKRLNAVIVTDDPLLPGLQTLHIFGLGQQYNQVLFNGAMMNSLDPVGRAYSFDKIPVEAIEEVSVQKIANPSVPADFAGGNISIKTKDFPDQNFIYVLGGGGFFDQTRGKDFYSDKRGKLEWSSFPGSDRNLPADFPVTSSRYSFDQKNLQEQVSFSKELKNNLNPINYGSAKPSDKIVLGFGKQFKLKKGERIGFIAFINHQHTETIDESVVQVLPDVADNPYPFDGSKVLIRSQSADTRYRYASQLNGMVNGSILFGRNKVSLRGFFSNQYINDYLQRSAVYKPDEDTLAHSGVNYFNEQRAFINTQLSGEHALGKNGKFKLNWLASYTYYHQQNPDERNFLLRQDSSNSNQYEIAAPITPFNLSNSNSYYPGFTNSGRLWRDFADHNFTGSLNLLVPISLFHQTQVLSGGVYVQTRYRVFHSDFFLTNGPGYFSLDKLLAPERYFPGGLSISNYYMNTANLNILNATDRANYTASDNLGASFIRLENHFTKNLSLDWGLRMETNSQLVSSTLYQYYSGFKNPSVVPIDENNQVTYFNFLPSANLKYQFLRNMQAYAAYFRSVNRPQLQELSGYRYYDVSSFTVKTGNALLLNTNIDNFDAGLDWASGSKTNISVSGFYKKIDQPIEYILSGYSNSVGNLQSAPYNTAPAKVWGLTASFKVGLDFISAPWLSGISIFANGNRLHSQVDAGPVKSTTIPDIKGHGLSGTPGYTVNAGLVVQYPKLPMLTVLYNRTGDYISAVGSGASFKLANGEDISAIPDYRVKGRDQLDIQLSQKIFKKKLQLIIGANNLLNSGYIVYQDLNGNKKFDAALVLNNNQRGGFYQSGTDNTVISIKTQRSYYFTISYLFK